MGREPKQPRGASVTIEVQLGEDVIGAVVRGVSLAQVPEGERLECIEDALEAHGVLVFPDQAAVTPAQQVAFSRALGPLAVVDQPHALLPGQPEVFVVGNTGEKPVVFAPPEPGGALEWHSDHIHLAVPARASLLLARQVPAAGGDTLFACMYSAYDALDAAARAHCDGLEAINSVTGLRDYLSGQGHKGVHRTGPGEAADPPAVWPLVRAHPRSGRKALYFGNQVTVGIVGWPDEAARAFIADLTEKACRPAFRYRHRWRTGDAVLWDNRRVLHAGTPYDLGRERRELHRTTIQETAPIRLPRAVPAAG